MKKTTKAKQATKKNHQYAILARLDQTLPLNTPEWKEVEQALMRMSEFAPMDMVRDAANAIAIYADDQAKHGYLLGQTDLISALRKDAA